MEYGVYLPPGQNETAEALEKKFRDEGLSLAVNSQTCACYGIESRLDAAVVHLHPIKMGNHYREDPECYERFKGVLAADPNTIFFLMALGKEKKRKEILGSPPNLVYLDGNKWIDFSAKTVFYLMTTVAQTHLSHTS